MGLALGFAWYECKWGPSRPSTVLPLLPSTLVPIPWRLEPQPREVGEPIRARMLLSKEKGRLWRNLRGTIKHILSEWGCLCGPVASALPKCIVPE